MEYFFQSFESSRHQPLHNTVNVWDQIACCDITLPWTVRLVCLCVYQIIVLTQQNNALKGCIRVAFEFELSLKCHCFILHFTFVLIIQKVAKKGKRLLSFSLTNMFKLLFTYQVLLNIVNQLVMFRVKFPVFQASGYLLSLSKSRRWPLYSNCISELA